LLRNVYNKNAYFSGNGVRTSLVSAVTNTLAAVVSENRKLEESIRRLLDRQSDASDIHNISAVKRGFFFLPLGCFSITICGAS
jgi:hypothetical protein